MRIADRRGVRRDARPPARRSRRRRLRGALRLAHRTLRAGTILGVAVLTGVAAGSTGPGGIDPAFRNFLGAGLAVVFLLALAAAGAGLAGSRRPHRA